MVASWGRPWERRQVARSPLSTKLTRGSSGTGASAHGQETGQGKESSPGRTGQVAGGLAGQGCLCRAALESAERQVKQEGREGSKRLLICQQQRNKRVMMQGVAECGPGSGGQGPGIHEWKMGQGEGLMGAGQFLLPPRVLSFSWSSSKPNMAATHQPH